MLYFTVSFYENKQKKKRKAQTNTLALLEIIIEDFSCKYLSLSNLCFSLLNSTGQAHIYSSPLLHILFVISSYSEDFLLVVSVVYSSWYSRCFVVVVCARCVEETNETNKRKEERNVSTRSLLLD